jgi:hypothetical protein
MPNLSSKDNQMGQQSLSHLSLTEQSDLQPADTPQQVALILHRIQIEMEKGVKATYDAQVRYADADSEAQRAYALAYLEVQGTIEDRKQLARLKASDALLKAELCKAEWDRCRLKMKQLESQQMSTQTASRLLEVELRTLK